ncbi:MAG TPA: AMP-binding protein [Burkholderiaceae bacterium]|nr:AMP-binding protein [Burkholderiaceae bacterium]
MNDPLSIRAAAQDAGERTALRVDGRGYSFVELAARVAPCIDALPSGRDPVPVTGVNMLEVLLTLYALLEARRPALLLHPRHTPAEQAEEIESTRGAAAGLPQDAAAILYTSGTTGRARGAVLTRRALVASARASAANLGWHDDDCWLLALPLARVGGLSIVTRCLIARRAVVLMPAFDAAALPRWIDEHRVTLLSLVPTMLAQLLDRNPNWRPPPRLRAVLLGGASASPKLLARATDRGIPLVITYGCTETCSQVVATPYAQRFDPAPAGAGRPLAGAEVRAHGERIVVRGAMCMSGYLGQTPLAPDDWFDTGDLGEFDSAGCLHLHARRTDLIVSGGENVYPAEVERMLEDCPCIEAAAVFGVPDEAWGQIVAAVLVASAPYEHALDAERENQLLQFLAGRLAVYKRPRRVVWARALPLAPTGKLDRAMLETLGPALRPLRHRI